MEYNEFKGKKLKKCPLDEDTLLILFIARILFLGSFGLYMITDNVFFMTIDMILAAFCFLIIVDRPISFYWVSIVYGTYNYFVLRGKDIDKIKSKLCIDELPTNVDLAEYFKQREIDLLEAEINGNIDLMKMKYLKGDNNEI